MKKHVYIFWMLMLAALAGFSACSKEWEDDIDALTERVDGLDSRVTNLEQLQKNANDNIASLQSIVGALQGRDYISAIAETADGYEITFGNGTVATLHNGETPVIGVAQDENGNYVWTVNGKPLTSADGGTLSVVGEKGEKGDTGEKGEKGDTGAAGKDGTSGTTPQLKIDASDNYWYVSYDGGATWESLNVKATGRDGYDGDAFFAGVEQVTGADGQEYIKFTLSDGSDVEVPYYGSVVNAIQSLVYVPDYSDGKITIAKVGETEITYNIHPANLASVVVKDLSTLSFLSKEVKTRADEDGFTITKASGNSEGEITLTVTPPSDLTKTYSIALQIIDPATGYNFLSSYTPVEFVRATTAKMNPLWWMAEYNLQLSEDGTTFALDQTADGTQGSLFAWPKQTAEGTENQGIMGTVFAASDEAYDGWKLPTADGRTIDGVDWHLPTPQEWLSVVPRLYTNIDAYSSRSGGYSGAHTDKCVWGYNTATQTATEYDSYWTATSTGTYGIRFLGTDYCSVWKYAWSDADRKITITSKFIDVMEASDTDALDEMLTKISDSSYDWTPDEDNGDVSRVLYACGVSNGYKQKGTGGGYTLITGMYMGQYLCSAEPAQKQPTYVEIGSRGLSGTFVGTNNGLPSVRSVRLFRDK